MQYDPKKTLEEFNRLMIDIRKSIPDQYESFMKEKEVIIKSGKVPERVKWLIMLVASVVQKCPVCIPRAVKNCLNAGWTKEEMLEACMIGVLIGGSSVMTYVTLVDKTIEELKSN